MAEVYALDGRAGEPIPLPLTVGPATGYRWQLDLPDGVQRLDDESAPAPHPGGHNLAHLRVQADQPGEHILQARLVRSWQPDQPAKTATINLSVGPNP